MLTAFYVNAISLHGQIAEDSSSETALYYKYVTRTLSHDSLAGRGYFKNTKDKAAQFIWSQLDSLGFSPVNTGFQSFEFVVNTFNQEQLFMVNGEKLQPGIDFLFSPDSRSFKKAYKKKNIDAVRVLDLREQVNTRDEILEKLSQKARFRTEQMVVVLQDKLQWSVGRAQHKGYPIVYTTFESVLEAKSLTLDVNAKLEEVQAKNVIFKYQGNFETDSATIICAHYDHLGKFGSANFNGASDNATGVASMLSVAARVAKEKPNSNFYFVAFAGEEAGLLGSKYFVEYPPIALEKVRLVVNLDITGDATEGITVVNGKENMGLFNRLSAINSREGLLGKIFLRANAPNSDHYWFSQINIPSIFIYSNGNYFFYHDVYDRYEALTFGKQDALLELVYQFLVE